ncbi:hypothetical protein [Mycoplasmopsis felis]|uniref:hypothetical protein n=1 Tax=Mycoplasmopsis felis TaxID=33923 RepID=UPI0021AF4475|nr:hypothetical protein [Mycoplasmopsis felis]UWV84247.1 hypothetical protein NWE58_02005 [Mycoplasmopsis felis]
MLLTIFSTESVIAKSCLSPNAKKPVTFSVNSELIKDKYVATYLHLSLYSVGFCILYLSLRSSSMYKWFLPYFFLNKFSTNKIFPISGISITPSFIFFFKDSAKKL